jgi:hypothetical protein
MPQRQNGCFGSDRDITPSANREFPAIKQTSEIDHITLAEKNFSAIQETASHLHAGFRT